MPKVKVFNQNVHPLEERFKGDAVRIAAQDYWRDEKGQIREMDIYEAAEFKGQYRPVPADGSGQRVNDAKYYKMIKLEPVDGAVEEMTRTEIYKCMARECRFVGSDAKELTAHTQMKHSDAEKLVLPEEDEAIKRKKPQKTA